MDADEIPPVKTRAARDRDTTAKHDWVAVRIRRLSKRSASTPPHGPSRSTGPNESAAFTPSAVPLPVKLRTSHDDAVKFIHVPTADTN